MAMAKEARAKIVEHKISKYNNFKSVNLDYLNDGQEKVLIVAQTKGDSSLIYGLGNRFSTQKMIDDAIKQNPKADVYIPVISKKFKKQLTTKIIGETHDSVFSKLPLLHTHTFSSLLKPLLIIYWETLNLEKYDIVISSSHSFSSKSVNVPKKTKHISYIHTPPKYLYDELNQMNWIKIFPFKIILWPIISLLRKYDYYSAQKADLLIANSKNVQQRIKKYYNRKSIVIYPPHNQAPKKFKKNKDKYFLFFSRLEKQKGVELVVKTCSKYNIPLVVVGTGSQEKYLKKIAGKTITIL